MVKTVVNWHTHLFFVFVLIFSISGVVGDSAIPESVCAISTISPEPDPFSKNGGYILYIIGTIASLYSLAYVCEEYFVPALQLMCVKHKIPDSVAGSFIMALGGDSPECLISFLGLFASHSALGLGTIVGSEIFNHMCICAGSIWYAKGGTLSVERKSFTRDCLAYLVSLILFVWSVKPNLKLAFSEAFDSSSWHACLEVTLPRAIVLILGQVVYVIICMYFDQICDFLGNMISSVKRILGISSTSTASAKTLNDMTVDQIFGDVSMNVLHTQHKDQPSDAKENSHEGQGLDHTSKNIHELETGKEKIPQPEPHHHASPFEAPTETKAKVLHYLTLPFRALFYYTIPDIRIKTSEHLYFLNIAISVFWIAGFSYLLCLFMNLLGLVFHISPIVMGLTFSAVGTSFPNFWSSIVVAKAGNGVMAISNALGSNTVNIFLCLGLPWFFYTAIHGPYNELQDGGIVYLVIILIIILILFWAIIAMSNWTLRSWMAPVMILVYIAVMFVSIYLSITHGF